MAKIFRLIPAIAVSIAAFFELCLTGRADRSWRLARNDSFRLSLAAGAKGTPAEHLQPRPGIVISRKRAGATPPAPALRISRVIYIGKYMAMTIFLAFVITVFVSCPSGRKTEDGNTGTVQPASMTTGTEAPSSIISRGEKIILISCVLVSVTLAAASIAAGLNPAEKIVNSK
jgi:hypothetical protein